MKSSLIIICLFAFSGGLYAEEGMLPEGHDLSGKFEFGGFKTGGNTETQTLEGLVEMSYSLNQWAVDFNLEGSQTSDAGVLTSDNYETSIKGKYDILSHAYSFIQLGYREDTFSGVYYEKSQMAGMGYRFFTDEPDYELDAEIGYALRITKKLINGFVRERLDYDPGTHIAIFSKYHFSEKDYLELDIQAELGNDDDFIKEELYWVHSLFENLSLKFGYVARKNTKPEAGTVATDDKLSAKLGFEF